jgi:ketosteroid isomerase-like protein
MSGEQNVEVMQQLFSAIERRDERRVLDLCHADVEFHWPSSLPYGGSFRGLKPDHPTWSQTWDSLQPSAAERKMDFRVVAANGDEVVVLWQQRGVTSAGDRFDGPVLGLYKLRDGKLARAQMFYFDTAALVNFLAQSKAAMPEKMAS